MRTARILAALGNPIAGAEVQNSNRPYVWIGANTLMDKQGTATFQAVNPEKPMTLVARTETAFLEPLPVNPKTSPSPVKLVVREGLGAMVRGRIADKKGRPLLGLKVMLLLHF